MSEQMGETASEGRGDRLALMRLYDKMDDAKKQELLRFAVSLARVETEQQ